MESLSGWLAAVFVLSIIVTAVSGALAQRRKVLILEIKVAYLFQKMGATFDPIPVLTPEICRLVADGKKIQAIKLYRDVTGSSLREAKAAVEKIAQT